MVLGFGELPVNAVTQYPSGEWGFVGRVDMRLAYVNEDGSPVTDEQARVISRCGPRMAGVRTRTWATREDAERSAAAICVGK